MVHFSLIYKNRVSLLLSVPKSIHTVLPKFQQVLNCAILMKFLDLSKGKRTYALYTMRAL